MNDLGSILSIWAHPDDETYLAGATMARARDFGQRVVCASASAGELGTSNPDSWPPARLGAIRRWEAAAAMAVLGVAEHHVLGLPDGGLAAHDEQGVAWARQLIGEVAPDTILTFGPDGITFHPDHIAVHRWVTEAWRQAGQPCDLLCATTSVEHLDRFGDQYEAWGVYMTGERPVGVPVDQLTLHVRAEGTELDRKLTALRAMATQTGDLVTLLDPAVYAELIADEWFVASPRTLG